MTLRGGTAAENASDDRGHPRGRPRATSRYRAPERRRGAAHRGRSHVAWRRRRDRATESIDERTRGWRADAPARGRAHHDRRPAADHRRGRAPDGRGARAPGSAAPARRQRGAPRARRSRPAFAATGIRVIAECKRRSPSRGILRAEYDPAAIARGYAAAGAAAISVLTEPTFFSGSLDHLRLCARRWTLPILRKDFIVSHFQIDRGRRRRRRRRAADRRRARARGSPTRSSRTRGRPASPRSSRCTIARSSTSRSARARPSWASTAGICARSTSISRSSTSSRR